jgi:hypothetical protein
MPEVSEFADAGMLPRVGDAGSSSRSRRHY